MGCSWAEVADLICWVCGLCSALVASGVACNGGQKFGRHVAVHSRGHLTYLSKIC